MSIKRNIIANYVGQFYVALIGIVLVPVYVRYMGAEAYGLIGFFTMLQFWFFLLDMGLTPTMARETARFRGGGIDAITLRSILRALEAIFLVIAIVGAVAIIASSGFIASQWLQVNELPAYEVKFSLVLMALNISLRWMGGLYRSTINGFERLVWLNVFGVVIASLRFVLIVPILVYIDASPTVFFSYQLVITVLELTVLFLKTYKLLPPVNVRVLNWNWKLLRGPLKFSSYIAVTATIWVVATQTDKLILSGLIPLADYAYYTLAVLAASGIMIVSRPVSGAILPRLTKLNAEGNHSAVIQLYRNATQGIAVIAIPSVIVLALFSEQVLLEWTGSLEITEKAAPVLVMYALGNGIMVFAAFPYYLQYAKGELKLHLIGNVLFVMFFIPSIFYLVTHFGTVGAGYAWLVSNLLLFLIYVPIVHKKFAPNLHLKWIVVDIGFIGIPPLLLAIAINQFIEWPTDRFVLAAYLILVLAGAIIAAAISSPKLRDSGRQLIRYCWGIWIAH